MQAAKLLFSLSLGMFTSSGIYAQITDSNRTAAASLIASFPAPSLITGEMRRDESALNTLQKYEDQALSKSFSAATLTGTLVVGDGRSAKSYGADMVFGTGNRFRLDIHSPTEQSVRVFGAKAERTTSRGDRKPLPKTFLGSLFLSPGLLKAVLATPSFSIVDQGSVILDDQHFLRITVGSPSQPAKMFPDSVDLYFDPDTHLLAYSVIVVPVEEHASYSIRRVVQYDKYSAEENVVMPHRFVEYDNDQLGLTFIATQVAFDSAIDDSRFRF